MWSAMSEKTDNAVVKLAKDVHDIRTDITELKKVTRANADAVSELTRSVNQILTSQTAMTSAMTNAVVQLSVTKTYEARLKRLEEEVFGSKRH